MTTGPSACVYSGVVGYLLSVKADVNIQNEMKESSLHRAACNGHMDTALMLLDNNADAEIQDKDRKTPLDKAASSGRAQLVELFQNYDKLVAARAAGGSPSSMRPGSPAAAPTRVNSPASSLSRTAQMSQTREITAVPGRRSAVNQVLERPQTSAEIAREFWNRDR